MIDLRMRRLTGVFALASVILWLAIFPLYMVGDPSVARTLTMGCLLIYSGSIALQVIVDRAGLLWLNWLLVLLPLGAIIQSIGLIKEKRVATWQGIGMIVGLLLLNNPDIEIISSVGVVLMMLGYIPLGIKTLQAGIAV